MLSTVEKAALFFEEYGYVWKLEDGEEITPSAEDIQKAVDKAASLLYDSVVGSNVRIASLLIEKTNTGFDVYVLAGETN